MRTALTGVALVALLACGCGGGSVDLTGWPAQFPDRVDATPSCTATARFVLPRAWAGDRTVMYAPVAGALLTAPIDIGVFLRLLVVMARW